MSLITTSRHPSVKARILIKELSYILPGCVRINRGKANLSFLIAYAIQNNKQALIIVDSKKNSPSFINIIRITEDTSIINKTTLIVSDFEEKKFISSLRVPENVPRCYVIDGEVPVDLSEKISRVLDSLRIRKINIESLKSVNAVVLYVKWEKNTITFKFYSAPSMIELGPRLKIKDII